LILCLKIISALSMHGLSSANYPSFPPADHLSFFLIDVKIILTLGRLFLILNRTKMKKQTTKKLPAFISIIIFAITFLLFNGSCSKDTKSPDYSKTTTGSSKIVYTDVNPDSVILKMNPASFNLDLNKDGINDFEFNSTKGTCDDGLIAPEVLFTYLSVEPASGGNMIMTNNTIITNGLNLAPALDSSTAIAPDSLWVSTSQFLLYGASTTGYIRCMVVDGYWLNVSDKYLGLKFIKDNNTYYGWARLSSSYSVTSAPYRHLTIGQLILKDYAYNSIPNQPILAGQTK